MIREYLVMSMLDVHRYLRRIDAQLIRMIPKRRPMGEEAYVVLFIRRTGTTNFEALT
jgi:hypothetical protein